LQGLVIYFRSILFDLGQVNTLKSHDIWRNKQGIDSHHGD
jgi:hypothetical protein